MWWQMLLSVVIKAIPVERLVAWAFSWLLDRYVGNPDDVAGYAAAVKAAQRVNQQCAVVLSALEDRQVTEDEVTAAGVGVIKAWAAGLVAGHDNEEKALRK